MPVPHVADYASVYATFPDEETARAAAETLLERELVACANLHAIESVYRWEGEVRSEAEVAAFLKTRAALVEEVADALAEDHPYDVPCAVAFPLEGGHRPYLDWVGEATRG